jgi:hypothetical protein
MKVARPAEGVEYVVVRVPGLVPQARLERCTDRGCVEIHRVEPHAGEGGAP